jgi:hypothetical protein
VLYHRMGQHCSAMLVTYTEWRVLINQLRCGLAGRHQDAGVSTCVTAGHTREKALRVTLIYIEV